MLAHTLHLLLPHCHNGVVGGPVMLPHHSWLCS
jgi:hypothetical protein